MKLAVRIPLLAVGAVVATGLAAALIAIAVGRNAVRESEFDTIRAGAGMYAGAVDSYLRQATGTLEALAERDELSGAWDEPATAGQPAGEMQDLDQRGALRNILDHASAFESLALVRPDGLIHLMEPVALQESLSRPDVGFLPWFRQVSTSGGPVVSDVHISTATRRPTTIIAVAVHHGSGGLAGYLVGAIRLMDLSTLGASPTGNYFGYLTDRQGFVVAHGRTPRYAVEQSDFSSVPSVQEALAGRSGAFEDYNPIEDEDRFAGYQSLPDLGWAVVYVVPSRVAYGPTDALVATVSASTLLLIVIVGLLALVLTRRTTGPLRRLAMTASAVAAGGRTIPLPPAGDDEVGQLTIEFDRMIRTIGDREDELRLRAAELVASNHELESFSYSVAHDLRAPLRAIDGFSRIVADRAAGVLDAESTRQLGIVRDSAQQMGKLIDDLLMLARLGRQELILQDVDPEPIVQAIYADLATERGDRHIEFQVDHLPRCRADPRLLHQVFVNLLSNAVKFTRTRESAMIEVGSRPDGSSAAYFVRDNGVGLEMVHADRVFGAFQRLWRQEEYEGTGVGLAIVQRIVSRHGGRVWVEATPDLGATFLFTLDEGSP
jgi:signal transduction histidine kinase